MGALEPMAQYKSGTVRILGTMGKKQSPFFPDVKTFESQGYKVYNTYSVGLSAPAGTPKEIVEILANSVKKATENVELRAKLADSANVAD